MAIGTLIISNLGNFVKYNEVFDVGSAGEEVVALGMDNVIFLEK